MRICICDDDNDIHDIVKLHIHNLSVKIMNFEIVDTFSAEELLDHYKRKDFFDIVFLDVEMDKVNGIEAAKTIRKASNNTIIIFVSNYPHYVFEAFRVEALHFLVKPILINDFEDVFLRALSKYKANNSSLSLKWQNERYIIKISSIKYVEGYKRHITVYTLDGIYEAIGKIPELLKELSPHGFIRTHQGFVVNMDYIKRFDTTDVILFDGTKVMISVRKRAEALQAFDKYLKSKKW